MKGLWCLYQHSSLVHQKPVYCSQHMNNPLLRDGLAVALTTDSYGLDKYLGDAGAEVENEIIRLMRCPDINGINRNTHWIHRCRWKLNYAVKPRLTSREDECYYHIKVLQHFNIQDFIFSPWPEKPHILSPWSPCTQLIRRASQIQFTNSTSSTWRYCLLTELVRSQRFAAQNRS